MPNDEQNQNEGNGKENRAAMRPEVKYKVVRAEDRDESDSSNNNDKDDA